MVSVQNVTSDEKIRLLQFGNPLYSLKNEKKIQPKVNTPGLRHAKRSLMA